MTVRIMPERMRVTGQRTGAHLPVSARQAGDAFWSCGGEVRKILLKRIDSRYPSSVLSSEPSSVKAHDQKMKEAKSILQEARNQIFEAVLPLFDVRPRQKGEEPTEADEHAHDYFVKNVFDFMVKTYDAWLPEFVKAEDVEVTREVLLGVAAVQRERLTETLKNFKFGFRNVVAPGRG